MSRKLSTHVRWIRKKLKQLQRDWHRGSLSRERTLVQVRILKFLIKLDEMQWDYHKMRSCSEIGPISFLEDDIIIDVRKKDLRELRSLLFSFGKEVRKRV